MDGSQSGRGQPHSKTSRKEWHAIRRDSLLECGCPLPLSFRLHTALLRSLALCAAAVALLTSAVTTRVLSCSLLRSAESLLAECFKQNQRCAI
jgi:hypothetical protein